MIDVHCHLNFPALKDTIDEVLSKSRDEMDAVITCGLVNDAKDAIALRNKHIGFLHLTLGIHPEDVAGMRDEQLERHLEFIRENRKIIVGLGEIGLDYHWIKEQGDIRRCKEWLQRFFDFARETKLPVVLHSRKAEEDVYEEVRRADLDAVVFHHYSGNVTLAKKIVDSGFYISMPTITPTSKNLLKIAKNFPLESMVTETDSPFNSPVKDQKNAPYNVRVTIDKIAEKKEMKFEEVDAVLTQNAKKIFNIE